MTDEQLQELKVLVAKYMATEGCGCCKDSSHGSIGEDLLRLLDFPPYEDGNGYSFWKILEAEK